jgi:Kelch motif
MKTQSSKVLTFRTATCQVFRSIICTLMVLLIAASYAWARSNPQTGGTWSKLDNLFPGCATDAALLLTNGSVLVHDFCTATDWYKLTPDSSGSYIKGKWTSIQPIPSSFNYGPFSFLSAVLRDGRVIIEGGEYNFNGTAINQGAIYDPVSDSWTQVPPPAFGDDCGKDGTKGGGTYWCSVGEGPSLVLADGSFLATKGGYDSNGVPSKLEALLPPPYTGSWIQTGYGKNDANTEQGATLLPLPPSLSLDPTMSLVMTVDTYHGFGPYGTPPSPLCVNSPSGSAGWHSSELYVRDSNLFSSGWWTCLGDTQVQLWVPNDDEMGPALLRPDGTVIQFGANSNSATAILGTGFKWSAGPLFPPDGSGNALTVEDGPTALLPNGNVLVMASPGQETGPVAFFELTPAPSNTLIPVPAVSGASNLKGSSHGEMLVLPSGQILFSPNRCFGCGIEIYTPTNQTYNPAWAPQICGGNCGSSPRTINNNIANHISGQQFNGMSQGSAFGDEFQDATNYPLVRITESGTGKVYYCRTHDHTSMGVQTGTLLVSTFFDCKDVPTGTVGNLQVVANGIPSNVMPVTVVQGEVCGSVGGVSTC